MVQNVWGVQVHLRVPVMRDVRRGRKGCEGALRGATCGSQTGGVRQGNGSLKGFRAESGVQSLGTIYCVQITVRFTRFSPPQLTAHHAFLHLHPVLKHGPRSLTVREVWRCENRKAQ